MFSLRWKLAGALLLVVLISVGVLAYLTYQNTSYQFNQYMHNRGTGNGQGMMGNGPGGQGMMGQSPENRFISQTSTYLWIAGIIAAAAALILGILLTRQITRPIRDLSTGAKHISEGDLAYRVKPHSNDELGELANSFNAMAVNLDSSEQSRKRLISDVAHELRTPLTVIEGTVDGIMDGVFQPDRERLGTIKEQTNLLTHLVSDLRDISLAESGQLKLERQSTDIADLVRRKLTQFEAGAAAKNIQLKIEAPERVPEINIDPRRIEQVVANLLSNALRHTPAGGRIVVSVKTEAGSVLIAVADNGEGIPPEHLPHIFERFYRAESSRSRTEGGGGVGLGLAIVKQMVEAHGGNVRAESHPGKGSTFYVMLPVGAIL